MGTYDILAANISKASTSPLGSHLPTLPFIWGLWY